MYRYFNANYCAYSAYILVLTVFETWNRIRINFIADFIQSIGYILNKYCVVFSVTIMKLML